jgi:uncharacterized phage-associated protein
MLTGASRGLRFEVNFAKCIQGIDLIAARRPGITQYYVCKIFFFADKAHLIDWGRPISGDRFVAMDHGPVPSFIYDLLKETSAEPDEIVDALTERVELRRARNRISVHSRGIGDFSSLSKSDIEYLEAAAAKYGPMGFADLKAISHQDPAYEEAWSKPGRNNEMDIRLWFKDNEIAENQLMERTLYGGDSIV